MSYRRLTLQSATESLAKLTVLSAVTTGTSEVIVEPNARRWIMTVQWSAGVSAGEVILESGPSRTYTGTWANEGSSVFADNAFDRVVSDSNADYVRVRVGTNVVGGTVTVFLEAEGTYKS